MLDRVAQRFQLRPDELMHAVTLGGILFAITSSYTLVKTARDALYLANLPATSLPYVYMGVGLVTFVVSLVFARLTQRAKTWEVLAGTALVAALVLAAFGWVMQFRFTWVPIAFYLWVNIYGLILVSQFWAFTNSVSDPREAKRIFGIIGGGGILGGLVGGLLAARLGGHSGLTSLLIVAAVLVAFAVPSVYHSVRQGTVPQADAPPETSDRSTRPWRSRYVRWLALAALCSVLVTGLLDYQFKVEIQHRYPSQEELARFFGFFYTVMNLIALTFQIFGTRWALQRLGAGWSAAILPAGIGIGAATTIGVPGFASVVGTRLWDQMLRISLNRSAVELFYFPIEPGLRRRAKAMIDSGLERLGDGFSGLLILGLGMTLGATTWTLAVAVLVLVGVWCVAWFGLRRGYVRELGRNLRRLNLSPESHRVSLREASLRGEMTRLLSSPYERVVLHGLTMLEENDPAALEPHLERLMQHSSPRVRARALAVIATRHPESVRPHIDTLMMDADPFVRIAALRAHAALGGGSPFAALEEFLRSEDPPLRAAALECLMELTPAEEEHRLQKVVETILAEGTDTDRAAAAEALGHRPPPSGLHGLLRRFLEDPELLVRNAALRAAGHAQQRLLIPTLIEALAARETRDAAREGLAALGNKVVGTLGDYLIDATVPLQIRREIAPVLGDIATQDAAAALFRCRERGDVVLAYRVLKASNHVRNARSDIEFPAELVGEDIEYDVRAHLFAFVNYRTCPLGDARSGERLLCIALNERMDQALNRVFRRLALLYPAGNVYAAYRGLTAPDPKARGNALEYLENVLTQDHRGLVMPLVGDTSDEDRLKFAEERFEMSYHDYDESLKAILVGDDPWLKTIALHIVGSRRQASLRALAEAQMESNDSRVRETAVWARNVFAAA
jgi:ATP:ADP antiporter, AAA family